MVNDDRPTMQPHLADLLTLFSRNTELVVADSSSTMSTWFSIVFRSTPNTLCDTQCKGAACQVSRVEALHLPNLKHLKRWSRDYFIYKCLILSNLQKICEVPSGSSLCEGSSISLCSLGVAHPFHQAVKAALELDAGGILLHVCTLVINR